jgi:hypothetical protein
MYKIEAGRVFLACAQSHDIDQMRLAPSQENVL